MFNFILLMVCTRDTDWPEICSVLWWNVFSWAWSIVHYLRRRNIPSQWYLPL